uniref:Uncharacterized protein n=1 Tax=Arundo donax TaxID=35708 RepID=A0A0A8XWB7_ARUDO
MRTAGLPLQSQLSRA